jgi:hypothetical protein
LSSNVCAFSASAVTRPQLAVDVEQGLVPAADVVLLERGHHQPDQPNFADLVVAPADGLKQDGDGLPALRSMRTPTVSRLSTSNSSHAPAARDDLDRRQVAVGGLVRLLAK